MARKPAIHRLQLSISDTDRHYYYDDTISLVQHPSETEERAIIRLLALLEFGHEGVEFGQGLSTDDEPDLWAKTDQQITQWIEVGQPSESRWTKAAKKSERVTIIGFGKAFKPWLDKQKLLNTIDNVSVFELETANIEPLVSALGEIRKIEATRMEGLWYIHFGQHSIEWHLQ